MTKYYSDAWRTGTYPTIMKNQIFLSTRSHSRDQDIDSDSVGKPSNWQWVSGNTSVTKSISLLISLYQTDDNLYAVVFDASGADGGSLQLSIGTSSGTFSVSAGVNKFKLSLSPGSPTAVLMDSSGQTLLCSLYLVSTLLTILALIILTISWQLHHEHIIRFHVLMGKLILLPFLALLILLFLY